MEEARKGLFTVIGAFGGNVYDPRLVEMNDENAKW